MVINIDQPGYWMDGRHVKITIIKVTCLFRKRLFYTKKIIAIQNIRVRKSIYGKHSQLNSNPAIPDYNSFEP